MSLFPEWVEAHKDDQPQLPERIRAMLRKHGKTPGKVCKGCAHLLRIRYSKTYIKCDQSKLTHGPGTDWRVGWPACGLFEEEKIDDDDDLRG